MIKNHEIKKNSESNFDPIYKLYAFKDDKLNYIEYLNNPLESTFFALSILGMFISMWFLFIQPYTESNLQSNDIMIKTVSFHIWALSFFIVFLIIVIANLISVLPQKSDPKWVEIRKQFKKSLNNSK